MCIKLVYFGSNQRLRGIVKCTENILRSDEFKYHVDQINSFKMSYDKSDRTISGETLLRKMKSLDGLIVEIREYKSFWPWSKVNGYYKGGKVIYINSRKLNRYPRYIANTITHELVHCADTYLTDIYIGHGDNSPYGKDATAPWTIGRIVQEMY